MYADGTLKGPFSFSDADDLTRNNADFQTAFGNASAAIANAIKAAVTSGFPLAQGTTNNGIGFGQANAPFLATSNPSTVGGGSSGVGAAPTPSITGRVTLTSVAKSKVQVTLYGPNDTTTLVGQVATGADGTYSFFFLANGLYTLVFAVDGALPRTQAFRVGPPPAD